MLNLVELFSSYLVKEEGRSPQTAKQYSGDVRRFRSWLDAHPSGGGGRILLEWEQITSAHIRAFLSEQDFAPRRYHRFIASLRKFWTFLKDVQKLEVSNPASQIKRPKLESRMPIYPRQNELQSLLDAASRKLSGQALHQGLKDWALLAFFYGTGLRLSECLGLKFSSITSLDGLPSSIVVIGKGNKERRVALSPIAQRALYQWLRVRNLEGDFASPYVWSHLSGSWRGQPFSARATQNMIKRVATRAGLDPEKLTPHKLRHSFASLLMENGRSLDEVKDLLGHASIATTQIYVHASEARLRAAVSSLPDILSGLGSGEAPALKPQVGQPRARAKGGQKAR